MGYTSDDTGVTGTSLLISTEGLEVALLLKFVPSVGKVSLRIHMVLYHIRIRHSNLYSSGALDSPIQEITIKIAQSWSK